MRNPLRKRKSAIVSADGMYYYIEGEGATGWLHVNWAYKPFRGDWVPFSWQKIVVGAARAATKDEVERYRAANN